ncbi:hypothetical protein [Fodinicola feengrottensis]|nr:hypothetical protein [Fodinicola feengrottensis]
MKSLDRAEARRLSPERLAELTESINDYTAIPVARAGRQTGGS